MREKPRLAIVSPFLDRSHGTERRVVEGLNYLALEFEIHVYSQRVEDVDPSTITWHRIPKLPGPHLLNYLWWFTSNHLWRAWDKWFRGLRHDVTYSPGVNCLDADLVSLHIVFAEYANRVKDQWRLRGNPVSEWPRLLHRRLFYRLIQFLERRVYTNSRTQFYGVSRRVCAQREQWYGRPENTPVIYLGLDHGVFNPERRTSLRERARRELGISGDQFAVLIIGNDWRNKGVVVLLRAMAELKDLPIELLVVSSEAVAIRHEMAHELGLAGSVRVLPPRKDVEFYYAAADLYAGPSLEDAFALPVAEAMACGLPAITSARAGASEIVTHGVDALVLDDPTDADALAAMIRRLYGDADFRERIGKNGTETARQYTRERSGQERLAIFLDVLRRKSSGTAEPVIERL